MSVACVIVAHARRKMLVLDTILPTVLDQGFASVIVVGDSEPGIGYRHLPVPDITRTTNDALVKRDVGALAAGDVDAVLFLSDDHALDPDFLSVFCERYAGRPWDVLVPSRYCERDGERIYLNVGEDLGYAGGHGAIYRRHALSACPFSAGPWDRLWDLYHSHWMIQCGFRFQYADKDLSIVDSEPSASPWL